MIYQDFIIKLFEYNERISKEEFLMGVAILASKRSTCKRLHVGSVITDKKFLNIKSYGYNGNYSKGPNTCDSEEEGNCGCCHSEINCIIKNQNKEEGDMMFITDSPCKNCSKIIINSGIKKVYYHREYRIKDGINLLKKAGIEVIKI